MKLKRYCKGLLQRFIMNESKLSTDYRVKQGMIIDLSGNKIPVEMEIIYTYLPNDLIHGSYVTIYKSENSEFFARSVQRFRNGKYISETKDGSPFTKVIHN